MCILNAKIVDCNAMGFFDWTGKVNDLKVTRQLMLKYLNTSWVQKRLLFALSTPFILLRHCVLLVTLKCFIVCWHHFENASHFSLLFLQSNCRTFMHVLHHHRHDSNDCTTTACILHIYFISWIWLLVKKKMGISIEFHPKYASWHFTLPVFK